MNNERRSVLEKINKLLALSNSPNANEAKSAAKQASELIQRYNVEATELERGVIIEYNLPIGKKRFRHWQVGLIAAIAKSNFCSIILNHSWPTSFIILGREINVETTHLMFQYLSEVALRLAPKQNQTNFLEGFAYGIAMRLQETFEHWGIEEKTSIIRIKNEDQVAIEKFKEENYKNLRKHNNKNLNIRNNEFQSGVDKSSNVSLARQVKEPIKLLG
ncbi:PF10979 family protein [Leptospira santarosai]|uniref:PF10979 family protein n=1 Tax=Leptospira santarosai TaxID=28183 RepID=A0A2P1QS56_9LEPT|nr:PF10979 family protein [Leptospira santarosai]